MTGPRIWPAGRSEAGLFAAAFSRLAGVVARTTPPNLFRTMAHRPSLLWGWLHFAARLMPRGTLPRRETELVILRVAHLRQCDYEFEHHARLGRRAGITSDDLERVQHDPDATGWTDRERTLLRAVDSLHHDQDLDDAMWAALSEYLDAPRVIEFVLLIGHYEMLATFLITLRISPDEPR